MASSGLEQAESDGASFSGESKQTNSRSSTALLLAWLYVSTESANPESFDDVRMRGFRSRTRVSDALAWIDREAAPLESEAVDLGQAAGRVLVRDVVSRLDVPSFRRAMMDGFALHAADTLGATPYNPLRLKIAGGVLPGSGYTGTVARGEAVSIMTGAPLPDGADAVLPAEKVSREHDMLTVLDAVSPEKHVGRVGEDIKQNTTVLMSGRRLRPQDLGVLSSIGQAMVDVVRRPRVRLIITGDELCPPGATPGPHQTVDANSPMLRALIERDGGSLRFDGITRDLPSAISAAMQDELADVVIVSGGSSVGLEDHAPRILAELGELAIHGVAMRPSSPAGMGRIQNRLVFLLPGNPVSCLCAYDFFAGRAIRILAGRPSNWPYRKRTVRLARKIVSVVGRQDYARVRMDGDLAEPIAIAGASVLSSTSRADGFVVVPSDSEGYPPGATVKLYCYDSDGN